MPSAEDGLLVRSAGVSPEWCKQRGDLVDALMDCTSFGGNCAFLALGELIRE